MATDTLQTFVKDWVTRANQANAAGVPTSALEPIFQMDLQRLQQGSTPLTNEQANVALASAAKGGPVLKQQSSKPDWNPLRLLGRGVSDIGTVGKGLITLPVAIAKDVSHIDQMPGQIAKGAGEIFSGKVGEGLQDISNAPGLQEALLAADFIPGVDAVTAPLTAGVLAGNVAGKALTPSGRKDISQHPLVNLLNLLPASDELGLGAKAGAALRATDTGAQIADAVTNATGKMAQSLGVDPGSRAVWRLINDASKQAGAKVTGFFDNAAEFFRPIATNPAELEKVTNAMRSGDPKILAAQEARTPGFLEIKRQYDAFQNTWAEDHGMIHLKDPLSSVTGRYPTDSLPMKVYRRYTNAQDWLVQKAQAYKDHSAKLDTSLAKAKETLAAVPKADDLVARLKPAMDEEIAKKGLAESRLAPALDAIRKERFGVAAGMLRRMGLGGIADQVSEVPRLKTEAERASRQVTLDKEKALKLHDDLQKAKNTVTKQEKRLHTAMADRPPAEWHYNISEEFNRQTEQWAQAYYSGDKAKLSQVTKQINDRYYQGTFEDGTKMFPEAAMRQIEKDSVAKIQEWQAAGFQPSFVHAVTESQVKGMFYPQAGRRTEPRITSIKEKLLHPTGHEINNVALSLTHQQAEVVVNEMWDKAWNGYVDSEGTKVPGILERVGKHQDTIVQELVNRSDGRLSHADAARQVAQEWVNPKTSVRVNWASPFAKNNLLIPKSLADNIDRLTASPGDSRIPRGIKAAFDKTTRGYRFAVTGLSPQHVVHIIASGGVMFGAAMTDLPTVLRSVGEARRLTKEAMSAEPGSLAAVRIGREASMLPESDAMLFGAQSRTLARLYSQTVARGVHPLQRLNAAMNHFDEHVTAFYKSLDYVSNVKKGMDPEEALYQVGKHFADHAGRSPMERAIFRSVVPFGAWTQHLIRYAFQFPADHPIRASIMANLATAELADQTSGLPQNFAQLFFLGDKAFDVRQFNPFRDIGNDFQLKGFIAALNPIADAVIRSTGYDPIAGTAELYPDMQVDPNTGKLVSVNKNFPKLLGESLIPQVQGVEALLGWSDSMRNLKASDPSAYWSTLARYLHFPWLPRTINIPQERAKEQLNLLRVASQDVSQAEKSGKWGNADLFNLVPFQGQFVQPQLVQQLFSKLSQQSGTLPAKDILPKAR